MTRWWGVEPPGWRESDPAVDRMYAGVTLLVAAVAGGLAILIAWAAGIVS